MNISLKLLKFSGQNTIALMTKEFFASCSGSLSPVVRLVLAVEGFIGLPIEE